MELYKTNLWRSSLQRHREDEANLRRHARRLRDLAGEAISPDTPAALLVEADSWDARAEMFRMLAEAFEHDLREAGEAV